VQQQEVEWLPMTVAELFAAVKLPIRDQVKWPSPVLDQSKGVYVFARTGEPNAAEPRGKLTFRPHTLRIDSEYEQSRWQEDEPVVYIGKTDQPLARRLGQFLKHVCGDMSPHAGGQILLLLECDLWVYWSPSPSPRVHEKELLSAFRERTGQFPFANFDGKRRPRRVRLL
jgi:hypothetical protein